MTRSELDDLKQRVDLAELVRQSGVELKKVGKNLLGCCPFHEGDREPSLSVNPEAGLWNCFGCEAGGDALAFLQRREGLAFPEAVDRIRRLAPEAPAPARPKKARPVVTDAPPAAEVMEQVAQRYQVRLRETSAAQEYLVSRGLGSRELWDTFRVGYADGTDLARIPAGPVRDRLLELGLVNAQGKEHFRGCLVVPLDLPDQGVVGFYGRRIAADSAVKHLYLPGPKRGVLNWNALKLSRRVFVAESVLDAFSLWLAGIRDVTCLYGAGSLPEDLEALLGRFSTREVVFCLDGDRAGREGVSRLSPLLAERGLRCWAVALPDGTDPNQLLLEKGPEALARLAQEAEPLEGPAPATGELEKTDQGYRLELDGVRYQVEVLPPAPGRLKVVLRGRRDGAAYTDQLNLLSDRARSVAVQKLVRCLELPRATAERHMTLLLERTEEWVEQIQGAEEPADAATEATAEETAEALAFLRAPDLVERILADMEALGTVGEVRGKLLAYFIGISRKLARPLSGIVISQSSTGKSSLTELVERLTPPEDVRLFSRISAMALSHVPPDYLKHKLLIIEERCGGEAADYQIRTLQSKRRLSSMIVVKDPTTGKMTTQFLEVEGPIAYLETTTNPHLNHENSTRCFEIPLDESEAQTHRIQKSQRDLREVSLKDPSLAAEAVARKHHVAQRLLEPMLVFIPYVRHLSFPTRWLRTRRDNERFLCLIEAIAFLHQHQRPRGATEEGTPYVLASVADYRLAYELAQEVLAVTLHELTRDAQDLWEALGAWLAAQEGPDPVFTRKALRDHTGWQDHRLRNALHELEQMEYLERISGQNGTTIVYRPCPTATATPQALLVGLTSPDELERVWKG